MGAGLTEGAQNGVGSSFPAVAEQRLDLAQAGASETHRQKGEEPVSPGGGGA